MESTDRSSIAEAIAQNSYLRWYSIGIMQDGKEVVLTGKVTSYYHKQVAQEAVRTYLNGHAPDFSILNQIDVTEGES